MKINFYNTHKANWGDLQLQLSKMLQEYLKKDKDFFVEIDINKSPKQLRGYWRLCSILVPHFKDKWGEVFDNQLVSEFVKQRCNYVVKAQGQILSKSLTVIDMESMNILIEKLYEMCEFFKIKDYELVSEEVRSMEEYFKK